eukprot:scaffold863_cov209-Chaetoceros_neogracile.AAC.5
MEINFDTRLTNDMSHLNAICYQRQTSFIAENGLSNKASNPSKRGMVPLRSLLPILKFMKEKQGVSHSSKINLFQVGEEESSLGDATLTEAELKELSKSMGMPLEEASEERGLPQGPWILGRDCS